ncbi:MAG: DUF2628 domain-containing protein [Acetobacteraceae bacterium]
MRIWTAHVRPNAAPVLIREGFSLGAFLFGSVWLLAHWALIPAALALAAEVLAGVLTGGAGRVVLEVGIAVLLGLSGRDLVRWHLALRGFRTAHVLAAHDPDVALSRLLAARPELAGGFMPPERA